MSEIQKDEAGVRKNLAPKSENAKVPTSTGSTTARTPSMSEIQKDEDGVRQRLPKKDRATEQELRNKLFDEPIVKKRDRDRSGAEEVSDDWRNPLNPHSPLVRNGARVRGETDTGTEDDAPIRFVGTSDEERRRQYESAMKRAATATDDLYHMLEWAKIDANNLTAEQDEVIDLVKRELIKKSVLGTLTTDEKQKILRNTQQYIYNETTSANGDPYPVFVDIVSGGNQLDELIPPLGTVNTGVLSEDKLRQVLEYGEQGSADEVESKTAETMRKYKDRVYWEAIYAYNKDAALGRVKPGGLQDYYDQAVLKIYNNGIRQIPITTVVNGKKTNLSVPIRDLIPPNDESLGAQVAREAMWLVGLGYNEKAGQGYYSNMNIDCSKLVKWAITEVDEDLGRYGVTQKAEYQMAAIKETIWPTKTNPTLEYEDLAPGDTLYWIGDESGEIKHTAIFIGLDKYDNPLMIEAGTTVKILPVRKHTANSNGEGSTLYMIKRMSWEDLRTNAAKNKNKH